MPASIMTLSPEANFWRFFWSTILSIIGLDLYLFTHGWFLVELGATKQSIGVSWAIFFLPSLIMLPVCGKLLEDYPVRSILLSFEIMKAILLWFAVALIRFAPSSTSVYLVSALLGISFCPFYPATYTLLRDLFASDRVVKYSNIFEVSLQLAGSFALLGSGFVMERFGFISIALISAVSVSLSCFFLSSMQANPRSAGAQARTWAQSFKRSFLLHDRRDIRSLKFLLGFVHQVPQVVILLFNVPLVVYVSHSMNGGPKEYGLMDGLYGFAALSASLVWTKWSHVSSSRSSLLIVSVLGSLSFLGFAYFPAHSLWPYVYMIFLSATMTSSKVMSRAVFIQSADREFIATYTPFFQMLSNLGLVGGAFLMGWLMEFVGLSSSLLSLAGIMLVFAGLVAFLEFIYPDE